MDELCLSVIAQIVISKKAIWAQEVGQVEPGSLKRLLEEMVANTDRAADHEVHLEDLFLFVIDYLLILLVEEMSWFEAECHIIQKLVILVGHGVEEESKVVEYVIE